jgi:hypothetical protein
MNTNRQTILVITLMICTFASSPSRAQNLGADETQRLRLIHEKFTIVPAYHHCYPAEVSGIALGGQPLGVLLAQITVENRSNKTITAVRLGWKVTAFKATVLSDEACGVPPDDRVLLSGSTPLIELNQLAQAESVNIGTNPLKLPTTVTKTVFIDYPILSANDVKSSPVEWNRRDSRYNIALYVSEIHYLDGTRWEFGID